MLELFINRFVIDYAHCRCPGYADHMTTLDLHPTKPEPINRFHGHNHDHGFCCTSYLANAEHMLSIKHVKQTSVNTEQMFTVAHNSAPSGTQQINQENGSYVAQRNRYYFQLSVEDHSNLRAKRFVA